MNVSRLHAPTAPSVQRVVKDGEEKDADFLALRLLNKRSRVKLSPESLKLDPLPGKGVLFAVANSLGYFAAVTCTTGGEHNIVVSGLAELRTAFSSSDSDEPISFTPRHTITLSAQPNIIAFASNDSKLVVGLMSGSTAVYDTAFVSTSGTSPAQPLHVFPSPTGRPPKDISVNPGEMPELVAVQYEPGGPSDGTLVELLDVQKLQVIGGWQSGGTPDTTPASVCWSPKGKQVAIAMQSGDISTFTPNSTSAVKTMVPRPSSLPSEKLLSAFWLSNPDFYTIFTAPEAMSPDADQTHMLISLDAKAKTVTEVKLGAPFLPFPGMRPPGAFTILLRQWEPTKHLLFVGDSSSSDVGLIGCTEADGQEQWAHFTLEETSTPSMPLDQEMMDTVLLGLAVDATNPDSYTHKTASGEDQILPPPPILYAYASDGTVIGWHLLNTTGKPYPGMKSPSAPVIQQAVSESMETETAPMLSTSVSMQTVTDQPMSGQQTPTSTFEQPSSTSLFGQPSAFGQPSGFSSTTNSASPFETKQPLGFGAFANAGSTKFGLSSFGSSATASQTPPSPAVASPMALSTSMADAGKADSEMSMDTGNGGGFGSLSLGGTSEPVESDKSKAPSNSMFGSFATPPASSATATTFGSESSGSASSLLKPATGFGAFGGQSSGFGFGAGSSGSASATTSSPSSAFGSSGFATAKPATTSPAFGSSAFGSKPAFGQSAFGQSSFGQSAFGQSTTPKPAFGSPTSAPSTGGFAAFASGASSFSTVAKQGTDTKLSESVQSSPDKKPEDGAATAGQATDKPSATPASDVAAQPSTPSQTTSPFTTTSTPSASFATAKPVTGGAFSNLMSSPSGFGKLDSGFGAFGSAAPPSSSPFFNPPKAPTTPSAFGGTPPALAAGPSTPTTPSIAAKPTFGAPSAFGQPSAFGAAAASGTTKPAFGMSSPSGSPSAFGQSAFAGLGNNSASAKGFGNFSAGGGGFGAFAGEKKSFSDLLKSDTDKGKEKGKEPEVPKGPISVFSNPPPLPKVSEAEGTANAPKQDQPPRTSVFGVPLDKKSNAEAPSGKSNEGVSGPRGEESEGDEDGEHHDDGDAEDFLSDSFDEDSGESEEEEEEGDEEEEGEEEEGEEEEEEEEEEQARKEAKGVAATPSAAPGPTIHLTDSSPPASPEKKKELILSDTTTPPGSPDKDVPSPAVASPAPVSATSTAVNSLGRPTTQPKRSSPLASAPINRDSDDDTTEKLPLPPPSKSPATENVEASAAPPPETGKPSSPAPAATSEGLKSRPKTPPLQGLFGAAPAMPKPAPFTLAPATAPTPSIFGAPSPALSSPKPDAGPTSSSLKGPSVFSAPSSKPATPSPKTDGATTVAPPLFPSLTPGGGLFGQKPASPSPAKPAGTAPTFAPPPSGNVFGQSSSTTPAATPFSLPSGGMFSSKPAAPSTSAFGQPSAFGQQQLPKAPATLAAGGFFAQKPGTAAPAAASKQAAKPVTGPGAAIASTSQMDPFAQLEEGMNKEYTILVANVTRELQTLKAEVNRQAERNQQHYKKSNVTRTAADLGDPSKWLLGDVDEFSRLLRLLEKEVGELKGVRASYSKAIRELETAMLKATMRKEEIVRFSKANNDAEFAKMLKSRTLGPEHLETQAQLRRGIRLLRDRIQKLEEHLAASKKRLSQLKMGKAGLRPPSLDTINRTYRNIDLAIKQQAEEVAHLSQRLSKLDLTISPSRSPIDFRSSPSKRIQETTPNVAATTAAALNAERAAQRLKSALLKARKEPLLNKQAVDAPAAPSELDFVKAAKEEKKEFSLGSSLFNSNAATSETPAWSPPLDQSDSATPSGPSHGHRQRESRHGKSVQLKKSAGSVASSATSPPSGFSWGPLPPAPVSKESASKLPFSLTAKKEGDASPSPLPFAIATKKENGPGDSGLSYVLNYKGDKKDEEKPFSLSSSWVTDDFEKK